MSNFELNLQKHSVYLKHIMEETRNSGGKNFIEMINELSKGVIDDIDNLKKIIKKPKNGVSKTNITDINKTNKDSLTDNIKVSIPFKTKVFPKDLVFCDEVNQKKKNFFVEIEKSIQDLKDKEKRSIYKRRILSSNFTTKLQSSNIQSPTNSVSRSPEKIRQPKFNTNSLCESTKSADTSIVSNSVCENNKKKILNNLSKMNIKESQINNDKDTFIQKSNEENDDIQLNFMKISQRLNEMIQKEKLNQMIIESLRKENISLEQKYSDKCQQIENVEGKFDEISNNFTYILDKIKSHQDSLLEDNQKLKDLITYILTCYNEKKFEYLNCIVKFISNNDTFIDRSNITDCKKTIFTEIHDKLGSDEKICEYLYSTENKTNISENKLFFENNKSKLRSCSAKEIKFIKTNENNAIVSKKVSSYSRNKDSSSKTKNTSSYSNLHQMQRTSSTASVKPYINLSKSQKDLSIDIIKNSSITQNTTFTAKTFYNCQRLEYNSESKENIENVIKPESKLSSPNLEKFLNNFSVSSVKTGYKNNSKLECKVISKDLEYFMVQKLNDFKAKGK